LLARRTGAQMHGWKQALDAAPVVAALLGSEKGWSSERTATALSEYTSKIRGFLKELGLGEG
jgi:glycerol-3-phosphate dehydrogenase